MDRPESEGSMEKTGNASYPRGTILRMQRMCTSDGPGIRSTVLFKGCPLHCVWCRTPEGMSEGREPCRTAARCIGCLYCLGACKEKAISAEQGRITIDRSRCTGCLACTEACPSAALEASGRVFTVDELVREALKDRAYFEKSGGGVTLSGGEPALQPAFAQALLKTLQEQGIHTALDTCGRCPWDTLESLLPYADLAIFGVKLIAPERHREFTGASSTPILNNLLDIASFMERTGAPKDLWIRTPVIPAHTASPANIRAIGTFIREKIAGKVSRWELCAYGNLCEDKYEEPGIDRPLKHLGLMTEREMEHLKSVAEKVLQRPGVVLTSGPVREAGPPGTKRTRLSLIEGGKKDLKEEGMGVGDENGHEPVR